MVISTKGIERESCVDRQLEQKILKRRSVQTIAQHGHRFLLLFLLKMMILVIHSFNKVVHLPSLSSLPSLESLILHPFQNLSRSIDPPPISPRL